MGVMIVFADLRKRSLATVGCLTGRGAATFARVSEPACLYAQGFSETIAERLNTFLKTPDQMESAP